MSHSDSYPHRQVELDQPTLRELVDAGDALADYALMDMEWDHPSLERWRRAKAAAGEG